MLPFRQRQHTEKMKRHKRSRSSVVMLTILQVKDKDASVFTQKVHLLSSISDTATFSTTTTHGKDESSKMEVVLQSFCRQQRRRKRRSKIVKSLW